MTLTVCHVSDTHGFLGEPLVGDFQAIVHSGDFLPNRTRGNRFFEEPFQRKWVEDNAIAIHTWTRHRPLLLTRGNHEFIDLARALEDIGVEVFGLDDRRVEFEGHVFHGFPWVPEFTSEWNFEISEDELEARLKAIDFEGVEVLVAHSPPYGVLDRNRYGQRCGSLALRNHMKTSRHVPSWLMCGHIHESNGAMKWIRDIQVSNAATTQRLITLT